MWHYYASVNTTYIIYHHIAVHVFKHSDFIFEILITVLHGDPEVLSPFLKTLYALYLIEASKLNFKNSFVHCRHVTYACLTLQIIPH